MEVHASTLVSDATLQVLGVALGASGADVLVSVQGDGVIQFDAAKEVSPALACCCRRARDRTAPRALPLALKPVLMPRAAAPPPAAAPRAQLGTGQQAAAGRACGVGRRQPALLRGAGGFR
jgi:hypothetical protein